MAPQSAVLGDTAPSRQAARPQTPIFAMVWGSKDLRIHDTRSARAVFSLSASLRAQHKGSIARRATVRHSISWAALTGPYLSVRDESFLDQPQSAHPGGETTLRTYDMTKPVARRSQPISLIELVPAPAINEALRRDPFFIAHARGETGEGLDAALEALRRGEGTACYSVPDDILRRFSIVGTRPGKLLVRIGLPGGGPCRYDLTQIGLLLPARENPGAAHAASGNLVIDLGSAK
ncbi:hypothetical protein [Novosphingobium sp.]|uniref:hypothetical protein n=1 Tax=Novosphingobium sp. TaxID=1874826 RepID=UPI00286E58C4|nr:hypothetical protein [Novosphingobium sp.]